MATLVGRFEHALDAKGRLIVPAKLRAALGETFIATIGLGRDSCVLLYPMDQWDKLVSRVSELPEFDDEAAEARRLLGAYANDCSIDSQGRVMLPQALRERVGINKEVVIIGTLSRAEVWPREEFERTLEQNLTQERLAEVRRKHVL